MPACLTTKTMTGKNHESYKRRRVRSQKLSMDGVLVQSYTLCITMRVNLKCSAGCKENYIPGEGTPDAVTSFKETSRLY